MASQAEALHWNTSCIQIQWKKQETLLIYLLFATTTNRAVIAICKNEQYR